VSSVSRKRKAQDAAENAAQQGADGQPGASVVCPLTCDQVLNQFDPPVIIGTYDELKEISKPGYQREHFIPNSNFVKGPGRTGPNVKGMGNYSEGEAITYFVYDDQSHGTEHKELTDRERDFAQQLEEKGEHATVREWLDYMESQTEQSLAQSVEREPDVSKPRATGDIAKSGAKCIRKRAEDRFVEMGVDLDAKMRNGQANGAPPSRDTKKRKGEKTNV
jgi:hypothetical protein